MNSPPGVVCYVLTTHLGLDGRARPRGGACMGMRVHRDRDAGTRRGR